MNSASDQLAEGFWIKSDLGKTYLLQYSRACFAMKLDETNTNEINHDIHLANTLF